MGRWFTLARVYMGSRSVSVSVCGCRGEGCRWRGGVGWGTCRVGGFGWSVKGSMEKDIVMGLVCRAGCVRIHSGDMCRL